VSLSAHCMSSSTSTSGDCAASSSKNRRSAMRAISVCCLGFSVTARRNGVAG
jgi:hypothetical protein